MKNSKYTWRLREAVALPEQFSAQLTKEAIHPLVGQIIWERGIQTLEQLDAFLRPTIEQLHDPFLLHDMEKAVSRIQAAVEAGEKILIYGDYDADGITSTTVMKEAIELIGGEVDFFLPNRFIHGYGPNRQVFEEAIEKGTQLIITVDNGVAGNEAIDFAMAHGVDVIITDHHELPPILPKALAIVHPRHPDGKYPFGDLAGVGVAFKVANALLDELPIEFLDLVAIGTIADLVSLTDENRALVKMGIEIIRTTERIGLDRLIQLSEVKKTTVSEETIAFTLAPKLNALGRLGEAGPGVELLTTFDEGMAEEIAIYINQQNEERKAIVASVTKEALAQVNPADQLHILAHPNWHEGVLGIVAGKIMQETGKPALVLAIDQERQQAKGSGRSVSALNLFEALNENRELLTYFGGHHMAAGMTLPIENIPVLKKQLEKYIAEHKIDLSKGQELLLDESLAIDQVTTAFIGQLTILAPFGTDNPVPTFLFPSVSAKQCRQIGVDKAHLKCQLVQGKATLDAIAFQMGNQLDELAQGESAVCGQLSINEWNGHKKPQLMITDFSVAGSQLFDLRGKKALQRELPTVDMLYLYFNEESKKIISDSTSHITQYTSVKDILSVIRSHAIQQLVVIDCPTELDSIKEIVSKGKLERVYLMGYTHEEAYLNGVGTREQYTQLYTFVQQQEQIDVRYKLANVAQYLKIQEKLLIFMIQVFFDLGFVTIENGVLRKVDNPVNHPLDESPRYQQRLKKIKAEEFLLYSDKETLQQWLWDKEETHE